MAPLIARQGPEGAAGGATKQCSRSLFDGRSGEIGPVWLVRHYLRNSRIEEAPGVWRVVNKAGEELRITLEEVFHDTSHELGIDPGLRKDGVEAHLQELLAATPGVLGDGYTLVRREYPTAIGPVDLLCRDAAGRHVAVEVKRRAGIDAVEQLTRYLELLGRDPLLAPVAGVLAAQAVAPQAQKLIGQLDGIRDGETATYDLAYLLTEDDL